MAEKERSLMNNLINQVTLSEIDFENIGKSFQLLLFSISELVNQLKLDRMFHPRAYKLIQKRKNFLVVAEDEPYFFGVYTTIREHEKEIGRWTEEDEKAYDVARTDYYARPLNTFTKE